MTDSPASPPPAGDRAPKPLAPRDAHRRRTRRFHRGTHAPVAIRWFGMTALVGHLRHLLAVAAASNQLDLRDWMRPEGAASLLDRVGRVLGAGAAPGGTLAERLGREVWIDFVSDTGDDRDLSRAVARMLFAEYALEGPGGRVLPRGDLLVFGGDTAYPAATALELERRLLAPWNGVLRERGDAGERVLLGIPGNHDWYDGLDGFGRLFRRGALHDIPERVAAAGAAPLPVETPDGAAGSGLERRLHLDEIGESLRLAGEAFEALAAILVGSKVRRAARLHLTGYTPVQEASYWAMPLAPGLDLWGVDRQLRNADFRQRVFFGERRAEAPGHRILFVAPDPAIAFGEPNEPGEKLLEACHLSMRSQRMFYLTGDVHHYERQSVGESLHVIAGGGGAFLHGSRIAPDAGTTPPECAYPDKETSRRLGLEIPFRLAIGTAGLLPHGAFALLAAAEMAALYRGEAAAAWVAAGSTLAAIVALTFAVRARLQRPAATWTVAVLFGLAIGLAPFGLRFALSGLLSPAALGIAVPLVHAFLGSFLLGAFLLVLALAGLEHHQGFAVLGHPGYRHFVRLCVHPSGRVEGFLIGKDDPLGKGSPVLVDRFEW